MPKDITTIIKRVVITNVVFISVISILNIFIDFEELHKKLPFSDLIEYQTAVIIGISFIEILILTIILLQWFYSRRSNTVSLESLLAAGENEGVEFKASLRWDYKEGRVNKELECVIARTIAGFMNAKGGTLLIGVTDEKTVIGLEKDYETLKKKNSDGFIIHLTQILNNSLGKENSAFASLKIIKFKSEDVCRIDVVPADKPVYVACNNQQEFFIRASATTQPMQIKEAHEYIKMHWKT